MADGCGTPANSTAAERGEELALLQTVLETRKIDDTSAMVSLQRPVTQHEDRSFGKRQV